MIGVQKTQCSNCEHLQTCKYKETFLEILSPFADVHATYCEKEAVVNAFGDIVYARIDEKQSKFEFLKPYVPTCKHFLRSRTGETVQRMMSPAEDACEETDDRLHGKRERTSSND